MISTIARSVFACTVAVWMIASCGDVVDLVADDGPVTPIAGSEGRPLEVGDTMSLGSEHGLYCGSVTTPQGSAEYPDARHFAVAVTVSIAADNDCQSALDFFSAFLGSPRLQTISKGIDFEHIEVSKQPGEGRPDGYLATWHPSWGRSKYGCLRAFAVQH